MYHVDFLNKNTQRHYPLHAGSQLLTNEGVTLPVSLFAGAQFTLPPDCTLVYLSRLVVKDRHVNISVTCSSNTGLTLVGYFDGEITNDYTSLVLQPLIPGAFGRLIMGAASALDQVQGFNTITYGNGRLEDSVVTLMPRPTVTSIQCNGQRLTGRIALTYDNIRQLANNTALQLEVVDRTLVTAKNDKGAAFSNCGVSVIGSLNNVLPDAFGNIDLYGIDPVVIEVVAGGVQVRVPSLDKNTICAPPLPIPPYNQSSLYLGNPLTATAPEWKSWEQYKP